MDEEGGKMVGRKRRGSDRTLGRRLGKRNGEKVGENVGMKESGRRNEGKKEKED